MNQESCLYSLSISDWVDKYFSELRYFGILLEFEPVSNTKGFPEVFYYKDLSSSSQSTIYFRLMLASCLNVLAWVVLWVYLLLSKALLFSFSNTLSSTSSWSNEFSDIRNSLCFFQWAFTSDGPDEVSSYLLCLL